MLLKSQQVVEIPEPARPPVLASWGTSLPGFVIGGQKYFPGNFPSATGHQPPINSQLKARIPLLWVNQSQEGRVFPGES